MTFEQVERRMAELTKGDRVVALVQSAPGEPYEVVWNGGELLPDRPSVEDDRFRYVPFYDLDEGDKVVAINKRIYNKTGRYTKKETAKIDNVIPFPIIRIFTK